MIKIIFNNDVTANLDLSDKIVDISPLSRRVESEKPGEAGVIVFDSVNLEFPLSAFPDDDFDFAKLDARGNYLFKISYVYLGTEYNLFQGLCDKSTIAYTSSNTVSFKVWDKLSSLKLIERQNARPTVNIFEQINPSNCEKVVVEPNSYISSDNKTKVLIKGYDAYDNTVTLVTSPFSNGQIIEDGNNSSNLFYFRENNTDNGQNWYREAYVHGDKTAAQPITITPANNAKTYSRYFYGYYIHQGGTFGAINYFDAFSIIQAIAGLSWSGIPVVNKTGLSAADMSLDFYSKTIFDKPLERHPLDALIYLAQSLQIYLFIDSAGSLVLQDNYYTDPSYDVDLSGYKPINWQRRYMWDKQVDYVLIKSATDYDINNVASWGEFPTILTRSPMNQLTREIFLLLPSSTYAAVAQNYFNFYNPRREAIELTVKLDATVLGLDLCKKVRMDLSGVHTYFIESLEFNLNEATANLKVVELS